MYDDPNIFYLSLHRQGIGSNSFYPGTGLPSETGGRGAPATNANISFNAKLMNNTSYICAWSEVALPIIRSFEPDLVIVSCGFDAAKGDPIGDCALSPECFFLMTQSLLTLLSDRECAVVSHLSPFFLNFDATSLASIAEILC